MHYVIIIVFIVAIIWLQVNVFSATKKKLFLFKSIFPNAAYEEWMLIKGEANKVRIVGKEELENMDPLIEIEEIPNYESDNEVRNTIIASINNYLDRNNSSTSDFQLIKDIVDRNCDAADDEIQTQIPVPLYCGLMGTMLGIIVGILYLWLSGDLDALLGGNATVGNGAEGIKALLGGVALAMISSIVGIALTTYGSWQAKQVKSEEESAKHDFLSWMQAELLPAMNTDAASAMRMMVDNLSAFNTTFAANTKELNDSLSLVTETTKGQAEILEAINNLKINRIAAANIDVYDKLKNCTTEIGHLGEYLANVGGYLTELRALNRKLDDADARSRMIEDMVAYFKQERTNIEKISGIITRSMGDADSALQKSIEVLKENVTKQNNELVQHMVEQNQRLVKVLDEQQSTLENRSQEMSRLVAEMTQLVEVKKTMQNVEKAMTDQNRKIDNLVRSISELAQIKTNGTLQVQKSTIINRLPKWLTILIVSLFAISFIWFNIWTVLFLSHA